MTGQPPSTHSSIREELLALRDENRRLKVEAAGVASANVRAAMLLMELGEKRRQELTEQKEAIEDVLAEAQQANHKKDEFMALISHELRTPLNGVLGMIELARAPSLTSDQLDCLDSAMTSARHLQQIIEDILSFSRLRNGKRKLYVSDLDIWTLAEDLITLFAPILSRSQVTFALFIDPRTPRRVRLDGGQLAQVLVHLVDNALKFTSKGQVRVEVAPVVGEAEGSRESLRFSVRDTGVGIAEADLKKVFESFSQTERFYTRSSGGAGLGLPIAQAILALMGSEIHVESTLGVGSKFTFTIPIEPCSESSDLNGTGATDGPDTQLDGSLLCVSSHPLVLESIQSQFVGSPIDVQTFQSIKALRGATCGTSAPNCALIDISTIDVEDLTFLAHDGSHRPAFIFMHPIGSPPTRELTSILKPTATLTYPIAPTKLLAAITAATRVNAGEATIETRIDVDLSASPETPPFLGRSALVLEDMPTNQRVAKALLKRLGCDVTLCDDGAAGVEAASRERFDIIFTDCQMPGMDGFEASRRIRTDPNSANHATPIIAVTANTSPEDKAHCIESGMTGFIPKPYGVADLERVLREALSPSITSLGSDEIRGRGRPA